MYAIFSSGGKQYRAEEGSTLRVERLALQEGDVFETDKVLLVGLDDQTLVGTPFVSGASIKGRVVRQARADKVLVFKKKRRKQYRKTQGHRQWFSEIEIDKISAP